MHNNWRGSYFICNFSFMGIKKLCRRSLYYGNLWNWCWIYGMLLFYIFNDNYTYSTSLHKSISLSITHIPKSKLSSVQASVYVEL